MCNIFIMVYFQIYVNVGYEDLIEPTPPDTPLAEKKGWRAKITPADHPVSCYEFDVIIGKNVKLL